MQRPEVRIVDNQQVTTSSPDVSQSEADYLLAKYGYAQSHTTKQTYQNPQSFEDMINNQQSESRRIEEERNRRMNAPRSISFDDRNINYSETKWSDMDIDDGSKFGIKIQIVTDMKIN